MLEISAESISIPREHGILFLSVVILVVFQLVRCVQSPLGHIPGSKMAVLSSWPLFYHSWRGNRMNWIIEQHKRYGPVVRISPSKVCVASQDGIKQIYSNKSSKSDVYNTFRYHDVKMCIGLLDVKSAHQRRKGLLPAFSRQNLLEMEPVIRLHLQKFLVWLQKFDESKQSVDVFKWFRYLTFDVVTDIAFGQQIGMLKGEDTHFIQQVEHRNKRNGLVRLSPSIGQYTIGLILIYGRYCRMGHSPLFYPS